MRDHYVQRTCAPARRTAVVKRNSWDSKRAIRRGLVLAVGITVLETFRAIAGGVNVGDLRSDASFAQVRTTLTVQRADIIDDIINTIGDMINGGSKGNCPPPPPPPPSGP